MIGVQAGLGVKPGETEMVSVQLYSSVYFYLIQFFMHAFIYFILFSFSCMRVENFICVF